MNAGPVADINRFFLLQVPAETDMEPLKCQFEASPLIEYVTRMPQATNPPSYIPNQRCQSNNHGIHAEQVYSAFNVRGAGVCVVDIEGAYNAGHADLPSISIPLIGGTSLHTGFGDDHGTAVLGQMVSRDNGWGITGIASAGTAKFACSGFAAPRSKSNELPSSNVFSQSLIWLARRAYCSESWANVFCSRSASGATLHLKSGVCRRLVRLISFCFTPCQVQIYPL